MRICVENATALVFVGGPCPERGTEYIVGRDDMGCLDFIQRYPNGVRCKGAELDNEERFFMCFVADCFDPPICIVSASGPCDAEEAFVEACRWADISETDLEDYDEETVSYGPSGQPYDAESVQIYGVKLLRVECDKPESTG